MSAPSVDDTANAWSEIQALVDEIAELAESETSTDRFHDETLRRLRDVTTATEATAWIPRDGGFAVGRRVGGNGTENGNAADAVLFGRVLGARRAVRVDSSTASEDDSAGETRALCPVFAGDEPAAVLEIVQPAETSPASRRASTQLLEAVAELVGDFHSNRLLAEFREREHDWEAQRAFCRRVYRGGSQRAVAFAVANEGREYADCARISVLKRTGRTWRLVATSGATKIESRSRIVRRLERMANVVLAAEREFLYIDGEPPSEPWPPQVHEVLHELLDESQARFVHLMVLATEEDATTARETIGPGEPDFAIVAEQFELSDSRAIVERVRRIAPDAARALGAARRPSAVERVVGGGVWWGLLGFAIVAGLVLTFVESDFTVPARGTLEPAEQRRVFAPRAGFVWVLQTAYGKDVDAGTVVVELIDPDLALEVQRVEGEMQKVTLQLAAAELARLPGAAREPGVDPSAQAEELEKLHDSLVERRSLLAAEEAKLVVRSPVAGRVVTWDLDRRLHARPVQRGDLLLEIARFDGPWRLRLNIPDDEFGHVRTATMEARDRPLQVEYALATEPERMHEAVIDELARTTDLDAEGEAIVRAEVALAAEDVPDARPGATVVARIHCGRRPLGYVWFHEAIHAVRTWWYR